MLIAMAAIMAMSLWMFMLLLLSRAGAREQNKARLRFTEHGLRT